MIVSPNHQPQIGAATNIPLAIALNPKRRRGPRRKRPFIGPKQLPRQQPRKNRSRSRRPRRPGNKMSMPVHSCSLHYGSAIADPEFTLGGACVPSGFPIASQKVKTFVRGTFNLGTTGQGFALFQPALANDNNNAVVTTSSTSVGTAATALSSFTNLTSTAFAHLPFTTAQLASATNTLKGRFVAGMLKVRYAGNESSRNGTVVTLEEPSHSDLSGTSGSGLSNFISSLAERPPPDGSWHTVCWSGPKSPTDYNWVTTASQTGTAPLVCFVNGTANDKYEFEAYIHTEYAGSIVMNATASHVDEKGFAGVVEAMANASGAQPLNEKAAPGAFRSFLDTVGANINAIATLGETVTSLISPKLLQKGAMGLIGNAISPLFKPSNNRGLIGYH